MKAKYCKCKNTYTINKCDKVYNCVNPQYYYRHGVGDLCGAEPNYLSDENGNPLETENGYKIIIE